jgi:hypothetical protein
MDKDLKDAVLAAFDGEPEDEKPATDAATEAADKAAAVAPKAGAGQKKTVLGAAGTARRLATPVAPAVRKATADREPAEEPAPAASRQHAAAVHAAAPVHAAPRTAGGTLSLVLTVALIALVGILLVQTRSLKTAVSQQEAMLKDLKNLARITVSVYHEPGKRPQKVIAVHDLDEDGKLKVVKMTIVPLEEE